MFKKKVFITGISGFLGYELAERCLRDGYEVAGLIRQHPQHNEAVNRLKGRAKLYEGTLTDYSRLVNVVEDYYPDYVVHLGAITPVSYSFEHTFEVNKTNFFGTMNITETLKRYCPDLKKFIFASSMETYGHQPEAHETMRPLDEHDEQRASAPYAVAKIAAERYVKFLCDVYKFPGIALRQTNTYGRKFDSYFVVEAFVTEMLKNPDVVNFGNPDPVRNFIYVDDLVDLYLTLFDSSKNLHGEVFTIGPPNGITIKELADIIARKLDWHGEINWFTRDIRDGEIYYLNSSNTKVTALTNWEPKTTLSKGLDKTILYWKEKLKIK